MLKVHSGKSIKELGMILEGWTWRRKGGEDEDLQSAYLLSRQEWTVSSQKAHSGFGSWDKVIHGE